MKNTAIIYGECEKGIQKKALELLSETILDFTIKYPLCVKYGEDADISECTKIYIGTKSNNAYIAQNSTTDLTHTEEYAITVKNGTVIIEGFDDGGVLYGCADFYNKYISKIEYTNDDTTYWENPFEKPLPDFELRSHPAVAHRGIWTWGHVIYNYRAFIDNMVKLKMNTVIIWNDNVPINAAEMVDYAHSSGIKIYWGYSWLWDVDCGAIDMKTIKNSIPSIIEKYEKEYLPLGGDGIYFQSFTEIHGEYIGDVLIAEAVTDFVNSAAAQLLKKYPKLELQFGLHAISVKEKLEYIKKVDPRVRIVWEDCGAFPFGYIPRPTDNFEETMDLAKKIAVLRGDTDSFGAVTKGFTKLDWNTFEHIGASVYTGVSSKRIRQNRVLRKKPFWRYVESFWLANADNAAKAVKQMADMKNGDLHITALVEDGMFEENIMFPVALYSEILWNPNYDVTKYMSEIVLRNYVEFA